MSNENVESLNVNAIIPSSDDDHYSSMTIEEMEDSAKASPDLEDFYRPLINKKYTSLKTTPNVKEHNVSNYSIRQAQKLHRANLEFQQKQKELQEKETRLKPLEDIQSKSTREYIQARAQAENKSFEDMVQSILDEHYSVQEKSEDPYLSKIAELENKLKAREQQEELEKARQEKEEITKHIVEWRDKTTDIAEEMINSSDDYEYARVLDKQELNNTVYAGLMYLFDLVEQEAKNMNLPSQEAYDNKVLDLKNDLIQDAELKEKVLPYILGEIHKAEKQKFEKRYGNIKRKETQNRLVQLNKTRYREEPENPENRDEDNHYNFKRTSSNVNSSRNTNTQQYESLEDYWAKTGLSLINYE